MCPERGIGLHEHEQREHAEHAQEEGRLARDHRAVVLAMRVEADSVDGEDGEPEEGEEHHLVGVRVRVRVRARVRARVRVSC